LIQHGHDRLDDRGSHAGSAPREARRRERHHAAHDFGRQRVADTRRMRANEVALYLADLVSGNPDAGERAKSGIDAVESFAATRAAIDDGTSGVDANTSVVTERNRSRVAGDRSNIGDREWLAVDTKRSIVHGAAMIREE